MARGPSPRNDAARRGGQAQRADDPVAAVMIAEEALKMSPSSSWASHAVLGFCCAKGDWAGALSIIDNNQTAGLIDKATYRRQRGVLLTARALELETVDRDLSRSSAMEAVKLAPTLIPAAVLSAKFESEAHQVRRAMRIVETAWLKQPHPDLADAYSHVRLGDSARQRLVRVETLAAKTPGNIEGALAIARAAIDAAEFGKARAALEPFRAATPERDTTCATNGKAMYSFSTCFAALRLSSAMSASNASRARSS